MERKLLLFAACASILASAASIGHQYRSDYMLDYDLYPEGFSKPTEGGRIHYTIPSAVPYTEAQMPFVVKLTVAGSVLQINLGLNQFLPTELNWLHCDLSSANILWVSLHANLDAVTKSITHITVTDSSGKVLTDTDLPTLVQDYPIRTSYVTSTGGFKNLVVHVHNFGTVGTTVSDVVINGKSIGATFLLNAGEHRVFTLPTSTFQGDVWTVNILTHDGVLVGNGGRLIKEHFPINTWQRSVDCPFPEANSKNFDTLTQIFLVDDFMLFKTNTCSAKPMDILSQASSNGYTVMVDASFDDTSQTPSPLAAFGADTSAIFCGDEVDNNLSDTPAAWKVAMQFRNRLPHFATYQGGKTYSYAGSFSGITDIQGKDFYIAGCAPHVTTFQSTMRIQGSYAYIKNTRNNQMPLTVWGYSQFIHDWNIQPNANEVIVQLASVVAGGAKGLMLFQVDPGYAGSDWQATVFSILKPIQILREDFRIGDIGGALFTKDDGPDQTTVEIVRTPDKLIVIVISTNASGYNDVLCYSQISTHWRFNPHTINNVVITLPADLKDLNEVVEVTEQGTVPAVGVTSSFINGVATLRGISLGTTLKVARFFIIQHK